jgi:hypothetical protein
LINELKCYLFIYVILIGFKMDNRGKERKNGKVKDTHARGRERERERELERHKDRKKRETGR